METLFVAALHSIAVASNSGYAFAAYTLALIGYAALAWKVTRNRNLLRHLSSLPKQERLQALRIEMGTVIPETISAEEWIRARQHAFVYRGIVLTLVLVSVLSALVILYSNGVLRGDRNKMGTVGKEELRVVNFIRGPLESGKSAFVNVHLLIDTETAVRTRGYDYVKISSNLIDQDVNPDARAEIEDQAWSEFQSHKAEMTAADLTLPAGDAVVTNWGPHLSSDQVESLASGTHAALLVMGAFEWVHHGNVQQVSYCVSARGTPPVFMYCRNHNGVATID